MEVASYVSHTTGMIVPVPYQKCMHHDGLYTGFGLPPSSSTRNPRPGDQLSAVTSPRTLKGLPMKYQFVMVSGTFVDTIPWDHWSWNELRIITAR